MGKSVIHNRAKKGKGHRGTCIKDPWTKTKGVELSEGGRQGWVGKGKVVAGKLRQLYLNNNKKKEKENQLFTLSPSRNLLPFLMRAITNVS